MLQYWLQHEAGMTWAIYCQDQHLEYEVNVYECGCKDLGEDGQLYAVLLGWAALLLWHIIVLGWWSVQH